ncbi:uncharacterized protein LOC122498849 [Leptopilina heterotoma]|uniref:uncharacterized protein LOC122498849 n=1 Tax=Leptopilina heterotoma TaxID=63436 RepID=UPI001CA9A457|nr:uncharacterized protein LOC122498849 [Leptopilina heterotoma]
MTLPLIRASSSVWSYLDQITPQLQDFNDVQLGQASISIIEQIEKKKKDPSGTKLDVDLENFSGSAQEMEGVLRLLARGKKSEARVALNSFYNRQLETDERGTPQPSYSAAPQQDLSKGPPIQTAPATTTPVAHHSTQLEMKVVGRKERLNHLRALFGLLSGLSKEVKDLLICEMLTVSEHFGPESEMGTDTRMAFLKDVENLNILKESEYVTLQGCIFDLSSIEIMGVCTMFETSASSRVVASDHYSCNEIVLKQTWNMIGLSKCKETFATDLYSSYEPVSRDYFINDMAAWKKLVEYMGFSPGRTLQLFTDARIKYISSGHREEEVIIKYSANDEEKEVRLTNHETLKKDVALLTLIMVTRGAVWSKIRERSSDDFKKVLDWLQVKYNIHTKKRSSKDEPLGPNIITLPRISVVFAPVVVTHMLNGNGRIIYSADRLNYPDNIVRKFVTAPMSSGLLPVLKTGGKAFNINATYLLCAILMDNTINTRKTMTSLKNLWQYFTASVQSDFVTQDYRNHFLSKKKILDDNLEPCAELLSLYKMQTEHEDKIKELRSNDPDLEDVIDLVRRFNM